MKGGGSSAKTLLFGLGAVLALGLGLFVGSAASASNGTTGEKQAVMDQWLDEQDYIPKSDSLNVFMPGTEAVAMIHVDGISLPDWNSNDGNPWDGPDSNVYTKVDVSIEDQWVGGALPSQLTLVITGDATKRFEGQTPPPYSEISGGFPLAIHSSCS